MIPADLLQKARGVRIEDEISRRGSSVKGGTGTAERVGPCPKCGGEPGAFQPQERSWSRRSVIACSLWRFSRSWRKGAPMIPADLLQKARNLRKQTWNCRRCKTDEDKGDVIGLARWLDGTSLADAVEKLTGEKTRPNGAGNAERLRTITYDFCDPTTGEVRYGKRRVESADGTKDFYFKPSGRNGCEPLLYGAERLADLGEGQPVFVVEGEKRLTGFAS